MRDRARAWKDVFFMLLMIPVIVYLLLYYFPFILWNETFARWSVGGVLVLGLGIIAVQIYDLIARDDLLLVINAHGIWSDSCSSKKTVEWGRVVDVIEKPLALAKYEKGEGTRVFEVIYRPDDSSTGKNASFSFNTARLRIDPEIIRKELRKRSRADGRQLLP